MEKNPVDSEELLENGVLGQLLDSLAVAKICNNRAKDCTICRELETVNSRKETPPPPPSTPIQQQNDGKKMKAEMQSEDLLKIEGIKEEIVTKKCEKVPFSTSSAGFSSNLENVQLVTLRSALEEEKAKIEAIKRNKIESFNKKMLAFKEPKILEDSFKVLQVSEHYASSLSNSMTKYVSSVTERSEKIRKLLERQTNVSAVISTLPIPLPPPPIKTKDALTSAENKTIAVVQDTKNAQMLCGFPVEEDVLSLQVLSARSSTPYTQATSCAFVSCDLESVSEHLNPCNEYNNQKKHCKTHDEWHATSQQKKHVLAISKSAPLLGSSVWKMLSKSNSAHATDKYAFRYTKAELFLISEEMLSMLSIRERVLPYNIPNVVNCEEIELEARLRRLNIWRLCEQNAFIHGNRNDDNSRSIDMMQTFIRRKTAIITDDSIIQSQPPQPDFKDTAIISNQRRSGRLLHNNWTYSIKSENLEPKQLEDDNMVGKIKLLQFLENGHTNASDTLSVIPAMPLKVVQVNDVEGIKEKTIAVPAKANYVKRLKSGFLVVSNPKDRETHENNEYFTINQNEEPEWFKCGPTSRLDTIELCGFDDDEEWNLAKKKSEAEKEELNEDDAKENRQQNKSDTKLKWQHHQQENTKWRKNDSNNNNKNLENRNANSTTKYLQEKSQEANKKSLPFQFDKFVNTSKHLKLQSQYNSSNSNYSNKHTGDDKARSPNGCSRFLPFIADSTTGSSAADERKINGKSDQSCSSTSLNEFFKYALNLQGQTQQQPQLQLANQSNVNGVEIPSVEQLESRWLTSNGNKNDVNNVDRNSETFKKLLEQLNHSNAPNMNIAVTKNDDHAPAQNLFNSDNLSNLIFKQQKFQMQQLQQKQQQQFLQQQQQQAVLVANLQLKSILSRPEAQMLLLRLAKGEISKQVLQLQLSNPKLQQRDREAITAVLSFTSIQQPQKQAYDNFSNNLLINQLQNLQNLAILQQTLTAQQQQQMLGNNKRTQVNSQSICQEELQTRANLIMQNAFIKRKIEEQTNILGMQKMLQLNAAATAAAVAVAGKQKQQHQKQQQHHHNQQNRNIPSTNGQFNVGSGRRRLYALQNLIDTNRMTDSNPFNIMQQHHYQIGSGSMQSPHQLYHRRRSMAANASKIKLTSNPEGYQQKSHQVYRQPSASDQYNNQMRLNKLRVFPQEPPISTSVKDELH